MKHTYFNENNDPSGFSFNNVEMLNIKFSIFDKNLPGIFINNDLFKNLFSCEIW